MDIWVRTELVSLRRASVRYWHTSIFKSHRIRCADAGWYQRSQIIHRQIAGGRGKRTVSEELRRGSTTSGPNWGVRGRSFQLPLVDQYFGSYIHVSSSAGYYLQTWLMNLIILVQSILPTVIDADDAELILRDVISKRRNLSKVQIFAQTHAVSEQFLNSLQTEIVEKILPVKVNEVSSQVSFTLLVFVRMFWSSSILPTGREFRRLRAVSNRIESVR